MRVFLFGAGYSGKAIARAFAPGSRWIVGTTRSADHFPALEAAHIEPFVFTGEADEVALLPLEYMTQMAVTIPPDEDGCPVLRAAGKLLEEHMPALSWVGYLSTVGVYGNHDGAWIDETADCRPTSARSTRRLTAEEQWQAFGERTGIPVAILRLPGIYGPGRNALVNVAEGKARRLIKPGQVFNRVHVDDIGRAAYFLARHRAGGIFNVTDDEPCPPQDVVVHACHLMGVEPPPEQDFETADLSPMARSFYGENKRVSNAKLKDLGFELQYPDYRTALDAMWADGTWRG
ncbi:NAD(P)-dependent oxidoreductase [Zhengella mangrovi]|uniref:NAD(P)-dependent oxidoreductase n=1 Tax=Zhengella mangrovi TaxID=1982044 RepID=A0A2G1QTS5_9HYPH|nr:SDR family oxidoreductase [Zhengella mangrovi]PHP68885.1 NAD(P)-dependent oxidoreductase [Zhengella mangrovi]